LQAALAAAGGQGRAHSVENSGELVRVLRRRADELAEAGPPASLAGDEAAAATKALRAPAGPQPPAAPRDGSFGTEANSAAIERRLRQRWEVPADEPWYPGRAVMVSRNDYGLRLFNGDIGLCLRGGDGQLRLWFETEAGARSFAPGALPAHE